MQRFGVLGKTIWRPEHLYRLIEVDLTKRGFASYFLIRTCDSNVVKFEVSLVESDCKIFFVPAGGGVTVCLNGS